MKPGLHIFLVPPEKNLLPNTRAFDLHSPHFPYWGLVGNLGVYGCFPKLGVPFGDPNTKDHRIFGVYIRAPLFLESIILYRDSIGNILPYSLLTTRKFQNAKPMHFKTLERRREHTVGGTESKQIQGTSVYQEPLL